MSMKEVKQALIALVGSAALCVPGCGGGTGTGNPTGPDVTIASKPYNAAAAYQLRQPPVLRFLDSLVPSAMAVAPAITSFKLCLEKIELSADDGSALLNSNGELPEIQVGMVDLGDGTRTVNWGAAKVPTGVAIKRLKVVVHKSPEVCGGADYSMSVNGQSVTKDIELKFAYPSPKPVASGDTIAFSLATLVSKLTQAYQAGQFSDSYISNYLDGSFEDGAE